jgi:hypothetical protein
LASKKLGLVTKKVKPQLGEWTKTGAGILSSHFGFLIFHHAHALKPTTEGFSQIVI